MPNNPASRKAGSTQVAAGNKIVRGAKQAAAISSASSGIAADANASTSAPSSGAVTSVAGRTGDVLLGVADVTGAVASTRTISAGTGLTGGGDLSANRTLAADFGSGAGKVCQGNDSRLSDSRTPTGTAGGDLGGTYPNPTIAAKLPTGGSKYAALKKNSGTNYDAGWYGPDVFNVKDWGAKGDGSTDDTTAIQSALTALVAATRGALYFPAGVYIVSSALTLGASPTVQALIKGDGMNVSVIKFTDTSAAACFDFDFTGIGDPRVNFATFADLEVRSGAAGCKRLIRVKNNGASSHQSPGCQFYRVAFTSDFTNYANTLLEIYGCWNTITRDCFFVGKVNANLTTVDCTGTGILVNGALGVLSVNGLVAGCRFSFLNKMFYIGGVDGSGYANNTTTASDCEGWTLRDNIAVGINYGITELYADGSTPAQVPWLSSHNNEMEVYRSGRAYNLKNVAYFDCADCVMLFDAGGGHYGFYLDSVSFSQIYSNQLGSGTAYPFYLTGGCGGVKAWGNMVADAASAGHYFGGSTNNNRFRDNSFVTSPSTWVSDSGSDNIVAGDKVGYGALVKRTTNQSIPASTDTAITWESALYNNFSVWAGGSPTRLTVPTGVTKVRLTANTRWANGGTAIRFVNIKKNGSTQVASSVKAGFANSQDNVNSPVLNVTAGDYFEVFVYQNEAGAINIEPSGDDNCFAMEIIA